MIHLGRPDYYPIVEHSRRLWAELEAETGQDILTTTGGLSIGTANGSYINSLLETTRINGAEHCVLSREELAARYPQHNLRPNDCAIYDPRAGVLRTDRAVSAAVAAAKANGATVLQNTPVDSITETEQGVVVTSGDRTWTFEKVIVASGGWSRRLMPDHLKAVKETAWSPAAGWPSSSRAGSPSRRVWPGQAAGHEPDHRPVDHCLGAGGAPLEVAHTPAVGSLSAA